VIRVLLLIVLLVTVPSQQSATVTAQSQPPATVSAPQDAPASPQDQQNAVLVQAVMLGDIAGVRRALADGANVISASESGVTPLAIAAITATCQ